MAKTPLTLKKALETSQLDQFIKEREAAGTNPADKKQFERAVREAAKLHQSADRTSRSPSGNGSTEK